MYNDIMDAVTRKLDEVFPGTAIYTDDVEQGLEMPCFFVGFLEPSEKPMIGERYYRNTGMHIQYHPGDMERQPSRRLNQVLDSLMREMEVIPMLDGKLIRGTGRSGRIEDGVLTFFIQYNMFLVKDKAEEDTMDDLMIF